MPAIKKYKLNNINSGRKKTPYLRPRFHGGEGGGERRAARHPPPVWCLHNDPVLGSAPDTDRAQWNVLEKAPEEVAFGAGPRAGSRGCPCLGLRKG